MKLDTELKELEMELNEANATWCKAQRANDLKWRAKKAKSKQLEPHSGDHVTLITTTRPFGPPADALRGALNPRTINRHMSRLT